MTTMSSCGQRQRPLYLQRGLHLLLGLVGYVVLLVACWGR
jgi:hypothetical protein